MVHILLILAFLLEPIIWSYSSNKKFERKYKRNSMIMYILFDFSISMLQQYTSITNITGEGFWSMFYFVYSTLFVCICFTGKLKRKMLHSGIMLIITLCSDIIVVTVLTCFNVSAQQISGDGVFNAFAIVLSKCVMFGLVTLTKKRISISSEWVPFLFLIAVLEIPGVIYFKDTSNTEKDTMHTVAFLISQMAAGTSLLYIKRKIKLNKREFQKLLDRLRLLELELEKKTKLLATKTILLEQQEKRINEIECAVKKENCIDKLEFFENRKKIFIDPEKILYVERVGRKIKIVEQDSQHEINSSIVKMETLLGSNFIKINQGTLVNKSCIADMNNDVVRLKNDVILYAARERIKEISM